MKGLILASGRGSRLMPLTRTVPRCMIPVNGKTIFERQILSLKSVGVTDIVVTLHHQARFITERYPDGSKLGVNLRYVIEQDLRGLGGGIARAREALAGDSFIVFNDNIIADLDLADIVAYHDEQHADATLVLHSLPELGAHGTLEYDTATSISSLIGDAAGETGFLRNAGVRVLSPRIFDHMDLRTPPSLGDTLTAMRAKGCVIEGYVLESFWAELCSWESYASLLWQIGRGLVPDPPSADH